MFLYNYIKDYSYYFKSEEDLIGFLYFNHITEGYLAHNVNDVYTLYVDNVRYVYKREFIVYDDLMRVIDIKKISKLVESFTPSYYYIPCNNKYHKTNPYSIKRRNKSYVAKLQEYDINEYNKLIKFVSAWRDELGASNKYSKSWKQKKIKKQWMKKTSRN